MSRLQPNLKAFPVESGVRQAYAMSPFSFSRILEVLILRVRRSQSKRFKSK